MNIDLLSKIFTSRNCGTFWITFTLILLIEQFSLQRKVRYHRTLLDLCLNSALLQAFSLSVWLLPWINFLSRTSEDCSKCIFQNFLEGLMIHCSWPLHQKSNVILRSRILVLYPRGSVIVIYSPVLIRGIFECKKLNQHSPNSHTWHFWSTVLFKLGLFFIRVYFIFSLSSMPTFSLSVFFHPILHIRIPCTRVVSSFYVFFEWMWVLCAGIITNSYISYARMYTSFLYAKL